ncbi:hypothetical protein SAMN05216525_102202 [Bradyrhizobium sp. Gha]|nr:hypothetical protein SAMN05216525_102202 [Bradyrhizobium sp. Gha]
MSLVWEETFAEAIQQDANARLSDFDSFERFPRLMGRARRRLCL